MARKASHPEKIAGSDVLWGSSNFWQPPRRWWPHPPTDLETLAVRAGMSDEELRTLLKREIQRRRREVGGAWDQLDETLAKREDRS